MATNETTKKVIESAGVPNGDGSAIVDGTTTTTITGLAGELLLQATIDIKSGATLQQESYSQFDEQRRPGRVDYLDGTSETMSYSCCGLQSKVDRDGVTTTYTYDDLKRQIAETRLGITLTNIYDGAGKIIAIQRIGTDGMNMPQHGYSYDLAGRLIAETNAVGVVTTYAESIDGQGQTVQTTTYASGTTDAATRIETYAKDGSLVKVTGTAVNPVRYVYGVEQDGGSGPYLLYKQEIKLDANGSDTTEWVKTYTDMAGRAYKTVYAAASGTPTSQSSFNTLGQLSKQVDPDGVTTLFAYNAKGELQDSVLDTDRNGAIDLGGLDRVTRTVRDVLYNSTYGYNVQRTRTFGK